MTTPHHHIKRAEHYRTERNRAWSRGFCIGFVTACVIVALFLYGQREAYGATRPAPRAAHALNVKGWPPHASTWLKIAACEQPKRGISWTDLKTDQQRFHAIAWHQTYNYSFPGGLGFTRLNWTDFRPHSARHIALMSDATPAQQLWAAERIYQHFARQHGTGYAATVWDCHRIIGWYGFNADGSWR